MLHTTKQIMNRQRKLWQEANEVNPAMAQSGSDLSWDDYNLKVQVAKDFDDRFWEDRE